jgi:hypothetical protein
MARWNSLFSREKEAGVEKANAQFSSDLEEAVVRPPKWSLGILNDKVTDEVPG